MIAKSFTRDRNGFLTIRGQNLQMKNLDVEKGIVSIKGKVNEMLYIDENQGEKLKVSLVSCLNELNNSVVYNAFNDWNGCWIGASLDTYQRF